MENKLKICLPLFLLMTVFQLSLFASTSTNDKNQHKSKVSFVKKDAEKQIDILVDGKLFTSYCWYDNVYKPILYPVITANGTEITRGFPLRPRAHERMDHLHQVGIWFNYGNVNGFDFWGNGSTGKKSENGGEIKHLKIEKLSGNKGEGVMITCASWLDPSGKELLAEKTEYHFIAKGSLRIIDRLTTLKATGNTVIFEDTKEGFLGIRVARQLELPSRDQENLLNEHGTVSSEKALSNFGVTGNYRSSDGTAGEAVWGTRSKWMNLYGKIGNENISITICDHPGNPGYPTFWHARGYGLFAANPLGAKDFTGGKELANFNILGGECRTFRYRIIIKSGICLNDAEINDYALEFAKRY